MGSIPGPTKVVLVPWDPDSRAHVERMIRQRIACGWDSEVVPKWQAQQREGKKNLQWVVSFFAGEQNIVDLKGY